MARFFRPVTKPVVEQAARPEPVAKIEPSQGMWLAACNGTETPFWTRGGHKLLYCWQPATGRHAYLNCETDIILTDEEARATLGTW